MGFVKWLRLSDKEGSVQDEKKVYSKEDLQKITNLLPHDNKHPERFWIPLIAIFSGARINELCQLHTEDIKLIDGIYCFDINADSEDKKLKNTSSKRIIAVHPFLLELGLIEYQEQCRVRGDVRLWMKIKKGRDGYGQHFGRWYNEQFNRKLITQDPKKTFHSFRHTVIDTLKQAGVQDTLISEIAGHKVDSMSMGRYGKKYKPETQLEAIKVLGQGLDLTPLKEKAVTGVTMAKALYSQC